MKFLVVLLLGGIFLLVEIQGKSVENRGREARHWFRNTYTETKVQKEIITSLIPSSCVHVEATLPPCRGLRNLEPFPEFAGRQIYPKHIKERQLGFKPTSNPQVILAPLNTTTSQVGWGEYLGLVAPTVTATHIELYTTTVLDPGTVVTFSVKGCRPSRLPMDLARCPSARSDGYNIEEILPTAVIPPEIKPTARSASIFQEDLHGNSLGAKKSKAIDIEPSTHELVEDLVAVPTEELSNVDITK